MQLKVNDIFLIPGNNEIVQHIILINKSVPQDNISRSIKEDELKHTLNKSGMHEIFSI